MQTDLYNLGLAFLEGVGLIVSPCILPVLPIILAGSLTGSRKKPFGIIIGFILVFALFTYLSRWLVQYLGINLNVIRNGALIILLLLGLIMISDYLSEKFAVLTRRLAVAGSSWSARANQDGFFNGILLGSLTALIWTPCAGPILAAVLVQAVMQKTNNMSLLTLLAFGAGTALPMLMIALFGREIVNRFAFFKEYGDFFRKILGALILLGVFLIAFPETTSSLPTKSQQPGTGNAIQNGIMFPYPAPPIEGISAWINSPPLKLSDLKGKVVLIDFWTYSCINCIRTFPYLNSWYQKYKKDGFIIIGVHSPEFEFEKDLTNVKKAVERYGIQYPVALDNQFVTWHNYRNIYWPAHFLIDKNGLVVYTHFGEGNYAITENNIRYLLNKDKANIVHEGETATIRQTAETYLGYLRARHFVSPEAVQKNQASHYTFPAALALGEWALQGRWKIMSDNILAEESNASIKLHFYAKKVFMVMGSSNKLAIPILISLNGKQTQLTVTQATLYQVAELSEAQDGILQVTSTLPGLEIYTFTFG